MMHPKGLIKGSFCSKTVVVLNKTRRKRKNLQRGGGINLRVIHHPDDYSGLIGPLPSS